MFLAFTTHSEKGDRMYVLIGDFAFKTLHYEKTLLYFAVYFMVWSFPNMIEPF